ncbi:hypothetical protein Y032_0175g519 [Ancylostoma ceylanicum]|nr:hypothetical protein Y032_0175g519 [Ancylostoma ceylanicum]
MPCSEIQPNLDSIGRPLLEANDIFYQYHVKTETKLDRVVAKLKGKSLHLNCSPAPDKITSGSSQITRKGRSTERRSKFNVDNILNAKMQRNNCKSDGSEEAAMEVEEYKPVVDQAITEPITCSPSDCKAAMDTTVDTASELGNSFILRATEIPALPALGDLVTISGESIEVDESSNAVSETIDVVGDGVQATKTENSYWLEGAEPVSSDEWEGDSTKAYKSDVEDEEAVDQCSTLGTRSSPYFNQWQQDYDVLASTGENCSPVHSFYLCGDEDISPKSLVGDNNSVDNFSTTVAPKTSSGSECTDDSCSTAHSYLSDQEECHVDDDDVIVSPSADPASEQRAIDAGFDNSESKDDVGQGETEMCSATSDTGCTAQTYVVPTPVANFAPLSYQNYMMQSYVQECESSDASDRTIAYGVAEQSLHPVNSETSSQVLPNPYNQLYSSMVAIQQQSSSLWTLKRQRSSDAEMEAQAYIAKRGVETTTLVAYPNAAGISTNPYMNYLLTSQMAVNSPNAGYYHSPFLNYAASQDPQLNSHLSQQLATEQVQGAAEQKVEGEMGPDFETAYEVEVVEVVEVEGTSAAPSPRTQRSQRARRLPARYRDGDYVCLLSDVESGDEVKTACSSTSSPHINTCATSSNASNEFQAAEQNVHNRDLSSSHFNLAGTRWNAVFSLLEPVDSSQPKGAQYCGDCGCFCASLETARRHVLSHIRLVRFVCKLCGVGGFFATDLRTHLMKGLCTGLSSVLYGLFTVTNAMQADSLCEDADSNNPGGVVFFDGERQIVSSENMYVHKPDAQIELKILQRCM